MELTKIQGMFGWRYSHVFIERIGSVNHLVLGDHVLQLCRRRSARLPCIRGCPVGKVVLFEEALANKFFQYFWRLLQWMVWCPLLSS